MPLVKRQLNVRIKQTEAQLAQIDAAMSDTVAPDEAMSHKLAILVSIPGIAETEQLDANNPNQRGLLERVRERKHGGVVGQRNAVHYAEIPPQPVHSAERIGDTEPSH